MPESLQDRAVASVPVLRRHGGSSGHLVAKAIVRFEMKNACSVGLQASPRRRAWRWSSSHLRTAGNHAAGSKGIVHDDYERVPTHVRQLTATVQPEPVLGAQEAAHTVAHALLADMPVITVPASVVGSEKEDLHVNDAATELFRIDEGLTRAVGWSGGGGGGQKDPKKNSKENLIVSDGGCFPKTKPKKKTHFANRLVSPLTLDVDL